MNLNHRLWGYAFVGLTICGLQRGAVLVSGPALTQPLQAPTIGHESSGHAPRVAPLGESLPAICAVRAPRPQDGLPANESLTRDSTLPRVVVDRKALSLAALFNSQGPAAACRQFWQALSTPDRTAAFGHSLRILFCTWLN